MSTKVNLIIEQGTTYNQEIELSDSSGNSINLYGYSANAQIRKHYTSLNVAATFVCNVMSNGLIIISLDANSTANIWYGRYLYDIVLTNANGVITRVQEGIVTVTPQITSNVMYSNTANGYISANAGYTLPGEIIPPGDPVVGI